MNMQKKAPVRQLITVFIVCGLFEQLTWFPELALLRSPGDVLATVLLAAALQAALLLPFFLLLRGRRLHGAAGKIAAFLYGIYFLAAAVYLLFCGYLFLSRTVMPETNGLVLLALLLASGCYIAARDTAAVRKTGAFFAAGSIAVMLFFFLLSLPQADFKELRVLPQHEMDVWRAAAHGALRGCMAPVLLVLAEGAEKEAGRIVYGGWIGFAVLFLLLGTVTAAALGIVSQMVLFPPFMQITTVEIDGILQRMDTIWVAGWGMALLAALGTLVHCSSRCLAHVGKKNWLLIYLLLAGSAVAVWAFAGNEMVLAALRKGWTVPLVQVFFCLLLPLLLLLLRKIQYRSAITVQKGKK